MHVEAAEMESRLRDLRLRRQRQARIRMVRRGAAAVVLLLVLATVATAFAYAGSSGRLAEGVRVAGIDVGGLSAQDAQRLLEQRAAAVARTPVTVRVAGRTYRVGAGQVGLRVDWSAAVERARERGDGFLPVRGFRRLAARIFGTDVTPVVQLEKRALAKTLDRLGRGGVPHRDAAVRLDGLRPVVVEARTGNVLDRKAAEKKLVQAFADFERRPVVLPMRTDEPAVTAETLGAAVEQVRTAVSAPVRLRLGETAYRIPRWRVAKLLELPANGARSLTIGGSAADAYFRGLSEKIDTAAKDAQFVVFGGRVLVKPSVDARAVDVPKTAKNFLAAALSPSARTARIVVGTKKPGRTTEEAQRMGISGVVSSYTTTYGGVANRIHNVQLVAHLIDDTLIAPGQVFSFNGTTGERNEAKGFRTAPVIINGELQTALGGGVCQVSTTVFNAAYEAGLKITNRTNHALYISHYPQGRDATVNYPDTDLKFVNDTGRWLLLRTFVGSSSLTVNLYGTPQKRRVESEVSPLKVTGPAPVKRIADPTLLKGRTVVEEAGSSALSTSVRRRVYDAKGELLYDDVWYSSYRGEKRIVRIGTKPKPKPKPKPAVPETPPAAPDGPGV